MDEVSGEVDIWPPDNYVVLRIFMFHHDLHRCTIYKSAKKTVDEVMRVAKDHNVETENVNVDSTIEKIKRLHSYYQGLKKNLVRDCETEVAKRLLFVNKLRDEFRMSITTKKLQKKYSTKKASTPVTSFDDPDVIFTEKRKRKQVILIISHD